jgi:hypothetical protein
MGVSRTPSRSDAPSLRPDTSPSRQRTHLGDAHEAHVGRGALERVRLVFEDELDGARRGVAGGGSLVRAAPPRRRSLADAEEARHAFCLLADEKLEEEDVIALVNAALRGED